MSRIVNSTISRFLLVEQYLYDDIYDIQMYIFNDTRVYYVIRVKYHCTDYYTIPILLLVCEIILD